MTPEPRKLVAHLVGSVPLADATTVFSRVSGALGSEVKRLPDGETGRRQDWIGFVRRGLGRNPAFVKADDLPHFRFTQHDGAVIGEWPLLRFAPGADRSGVRFETGYAADAIFAFAEFERLQQDGVIPPGVRYQICGASPLAIAYMYIVPDDRVDFVAVYARHLAGEIANIAAALPPARLAWQWDVCQEVLMWEGYFPQHAGWRDEIIASLASCAAAVPEPIELGYHFCYGSPQDQHCVIPRDLAHVVEMANEVLARVTRPVNFVHMPVPRERNDAAFVAPLKHLKLPRGTELYLGCVHPNDDAGNRAKLAAAQEIVAIAGVGSECGWGRGDPTRLDAILAAHKALIEQ